jgi:hypothetical protein
VTATATLGDLVEPRSVLLRRVEVGDAWDPRLRAGLDEGVAEPVRAALVGDIERPAHPVEL